MKRTKYITNREITRSWGWGFLHSVTIRKGSYVAPADNLPEGSGFWLRFTPPAMATNEDFKGWLDTYGILIDSEDVTEVKG